MNRLAAWLGLSAGIVIADQLTKHSITSLLERGEHVKVTPFFDIVLVYNSGAAFSFLAGASGWQRWFFVALAIAISIWLVRLVSRHRAERLMPLSLSMILGGAVGNVIDRIVHGYVVDFVHAHWGAAYFPAFNIADSAITIGAALLMLDAFREKRA